MQGSGAQPQCVVVRVCVQGQAREVREECSSVQKETSVSLRPSGRTTRGTFRLIMSGRNGV